MPLRVQLTAPASFMYIASVLLSVDCLICGVIKLLAFIVSFILFWPTRSVFRVHRVASRSFTVSFCWTAETEPEHLSC